MRNKQNGFLTTKTDTKKATENLRDPITSIEPRSFKKTDWKERINQAKEAREFGQKLRKGKPITFQSRGWLR